MKLITLALVLGMLAGGAAQAATCSAHGSGGDALLAGSPGDLDTSDMTFRGSEADGCSGVYQGNDSAAEVYAVAAQLGSELDALQPRMTVSYQANTWALAYGADLAGFYDLIVVVKQATGWAVFRFADELFATDGSGSGTFFIDWCQGGPNMRFDCSSDALSHMSVYLSWAEGEMPEPATLMLVALGVGGLYRARRRFSQVPVLSRWLASCFAAGDRKKRGQSSP